jgi:UDP-N-acetylmuramoylalanine--D-glutamate ligase
LDLVASTRFDVSVLLNITPDHLDRHGNMEGYVQAKSHIFDRQGACDTAIVAVDDGYTQRVVRELEKQNAQLITLSAYGNPAILTATNAEIIDTRDAAHINLSAIRSLQGQHNWQNALAAYACARAVGIAPEVIAAALQSFPGLAHRMEWVAEKDNVTFVNDSKATNADATSHALKSFEQIYWIAGGKAKSGGIETLTPYFSRIQKAYLIGEAEAQFAETLHGKLEFEKCATMQVAIRRAFEDASASGKKSVVLLSPACASFDQYANFEQRGEHFKKLVGAL